MFRTLFIAFFMATSVVLYMDGRESTVSDKVAAPFVASYDAPVAVPEKVRTVSKRFEKVNADRRFTDKDDIAEQLERKHRNKLIYAGVKTQAIYPIFAVEAPKKKALTSQNKYRIAIKMKSELKRVGCFRGAVSGSWDENVFKALSHFNATTGQSLETGKPSLTGLTALQDHKTRACRSRYRAVQTILPLTLAHLPIKKPGSFMQAQVLAEPATASFPPKVVALVAAVKSVSLANKLVKKARQKKTRKIARFEEVYESVQQNDYFGYNTRKRRPASTVGRRIKKSARVKRKSRSKARATSSRRKISNYAKVRSAKRHRARKKKSRKARRRYGRRYRRARRRFGFSQNGELGYW